MVERMFGQKVKLKAIEVPWGAGVQGSASSTASSPLCSAVLSTDSGLLQSAGCWSSQAVFLQVTATADGALQGVQVWGFLHTFCGKEMYQ